MLTPAEEEFIRARARVPEQIIPYVTAVSGAEPFLSRDFVFYRSGRALIFVGYPLQGEADGERINAALKDARERTGPASVSLITPLAARPSRDYEMRDSDRYYGLPLPLARVPSKVVNMLRRASGDLHILHGSTFGPPHAEILGDFLVSRNLPPLTASLLSMVPRYVKSSPSAVLFTAYDSAQRVVGFSVADYWPDRSAFSMFSITSVTRRQPGLSDLLLSAVIQEAQRTGKTWINLGLGINRGITFFKEKWGARPRDPYYWFHHDVTLRKGPLGLVRGLFRD